MSSRNAPSVSYTVGRFPWLVRVLALLWLMGAVATCAWWSASAEHDWRPGLGAVAVLLSGGGLWHGIRHLPTGRLQWDGWAWSWRDQFDPARSLPAPQVVLDLQGLILIRWPGQTDLPSFLWVDGASDPAHWLDLRRALHARPHQDGASAALAGDDAQP